MKEQIDEKNCKDCLHFEACCKWTDFPKQIGFPVCRKYSKQREGEWIKDEESKFEHRYHCPGCNFYLIGEPTKYCEDCGVKMKGGE